MLGDLLVGNGDPSIVMFPQAVTPNHHKLAQDFVTLEKFDCIGETSADGWSWSTQVRANDYNQKASPASYGNGFGTLDVWATDRNLVVGMGSDVQNRTQFNARITQLLDPSGSSDVLPGSKDIGSVDGHSDLPANAVGGYLWDEDVRRGMTLRTLAFTRITHIISFLRRCLSPSRGRRSRTAFRRDRRFARRCATTTTSIIAGST